MQLAQQYLLTQIHELNITQSSYHDIHVAKVCNESFNKI